MRAHTAHPPKDRPISKGETSWSDTRTECFFQLFYIRTAVPRPGEQSTVQYLYDTVAPRAILVGLGVIHQSAWFLCLTVIGGVQWTRNHSVGPVSGVWG